MTLVTFAAFGLALSYAISVMFKPSAHPQQQCLVVKDKNEVPVDTTTSQLAVNSSPLWDVFLSF